MKTLAVAPAGTRQPVADVVVATGGGQPDGGELRARARAFAEPLLAGETTASGENVLSHADAVADILAGIGGSEALQAAAYLSYASAQLNRPEEVIGKAFGDSGARLAIETSRLEQLQQRSRASRQELSADTEQASQQTEFVRKMLLAFSRDLRVVLLRLASRLQTLRYYAAARRAPPPGLLRESHEVFAPLANRLGIWQVKWEMEDLVFRAQEPDTYRHIAGLLDEKRVERELALEQRRAAIESALRAQGIDASVSGRPKHISSIVRKMRGKALDFDQVFDVRALRILVPTVVDCYTALGWVHQHFTPVPEEFDDYIARPKPNGYRSLHTVVRDADGRAWEIQIRTHDMHQHAEHGVAAHWAYKEAGTKGYAGVSAAGEYDAKIAVLRQLLAWERELSGAAPQHGLFDDRIYVLTPEAAIVELPAGATAVDFAYTLHTELGHRCRGARVDGAMLPLHTPLKNGQTVEIIAAKEGGPSRDWLNPELRYLASSRAKAKVRAWFNAQHTRETVARGREMVEKLLQREGRTALSLEHLASELGFKTSDALFETVGKDELSLRAIETVLRPPEPAPAADDQVLLRKARPDSDGQRGGVLVVGLDSLLTQPARCCKPAPPDDIAGYVTRGRGVTIHRRDCASFRDLQAREPERVIEVGWSTPATGHAPAYPVDVAVEALDRQGLLRDISDVFAREKMNVIGVQTQSVKGWAWMTFTVEVSDTQRLAQVLRQVQDVAGVRVAKRR
ncbi:MAG TPA: bifunctional (p)ppGpp synthetase/guanosine-3',5'-bis(diphosphate) 3'-pyrophosphohydrolase [Ottowia sp.]|jgi:GTP pyrophosphokinase|nr:MAG: GTP pyrophosphokinase [Burkholderiales bacterium 68-10]HMT65395.1 bifunctional (p)ppGpp synthetase/guanosine-3',5'-bis(diphosphate) 3'-pyrophosphohydrolase [Ottowia sp.]HMT83514.1 bifunctional (p)ppGpp synthetase/guanosine-3',5'-bis(diphosphate) 3'-pyrophosphohydrolase [Ottowia sp.]HOK12269.1 bifunctional (p)ppGpp synthetase/guanosine-3',5'-bis(diphosphate) 3'-pyrophosphohydrolase [Ottowia sp.]HOM19653.1 bifunctional (p)ppGpp synthetase/guanosine-3',5'-bis(diphosphate) 3'-pyrophosphohyd